MFKARENVLERDDIKSRDLEFAIYNTCFAGMNGDRPFKKIKKPSDLYRLPSDDIKTKEFNGEFRQDLAEAARRGQYK